MTNEDIIREVSTKLKVYSSGLTLPILSTMLQVTENKMRVALRLALADGRLLMHKAHGSILYSLPLDPTCGPLTPSVLVNKMKGSYDGAELKPLPGLMPERYEAFSLPSRMGKYRVWPDGRMETAE